MKKIVFSITKDTIMEELDDLEKNLDQLEHTGIIDRTTTTRVHSIEVKKEDKSPKKSTPKKKGIFQRIMGVIGTIGCRSSEPTSHHVPAEEEFRDWDCFRTYITSAAQEDLGRCKFLLEKDPNRRWFGQPINPNSELEPEMNSIQYLSRILFDIYGKGSGKQDLLSSLSWEGGWYIGETANVKQNGKETLKPCGYGTVFFTNSEGFLSYYYSGKWSIQKDRVFLTGWQLVCTSDGQFIKEKGEFDPNLDLNGTGCFRQSSLGEGFSGTFLHGRPMEGLGDVDVATPDARLKGMVFRGNFYKGGLIGKGTVLYRKTQFVGETFLPGKPYTGKGTFIHADGSIFKGSYKNGICEDAFTFEHSGQTWHGKIARGWLTDVRVDDTNLADRSKNFFKLSCFTNPIKKSEDQIFEVSGIRIYDGHNVIGPDGFFHYQIFKDTGVDQHERITLRIVNPLKNDLNGKTCHLVWVYSNAKDGGRSLQDDGGEEVDVGGKGKKKKK